MKDNPIIALINFRNSQSTFKDADSERLNSIIKSMPAVDKQKFTRYCEDTQAIENLDNVLELAPFKIELKDDNLKVMLDQEISNLYTSEIYSLAFQFLAIAWYQKHATNPSHPETLAIIQIFSNCKYQNHEIINSMIFELVCVKYLRAFPKDLNENIIETIFLLISQNRFPTKHFFQSLIFICRTVANAGNSKLTGIMVSTVETLTAKRYQVINVPDISPLVIILQQEIASLNLNAFSAVCRLSNFSDSTILNDSFILFPPIFFSFAVTNTPRDNLYKVQKNTEQKTEYTQEDFKLQFQQLKQPPYDELDYVLAVNTVVHCKSASIAEILTLARPEMRELFLKSMFNLIETVNVFEYLIALYHSFIIILKSSATPSILSNLCQNIVMGKIFEPTVTIFSEIPIEKEILSMRRMFFDAVKHVHPETILTIYNVKNPILFAENLIRAQISGFSPILFVEDQILTKINTVFVSLRGLTNNIESIRAQIAIFSFLLWPLQSSTTYLKCLESSPFSSAFSSNMYEIELTSYTIRALRDALARVDCDRNVSGVATSFSEACTMCLNDPENPRSKLLATCISECLSDAVCDEIALQFEACLYSLLNYLSKVNDSEILYNFLKFFVKICRCNIKIFDNHHFLMKIISVIHSTEKTCSSKVLDILFGILSGGSAFTSIVLIREPVAIPLIIAAAGLSQHLPTVFSRFMKLANESDYNRTKIHDGGLDSIILQYCNSKPDEDGVAEVNFGRINFKLKIDQNTWTETVKPLLFLIFRSKSNNEIASLVAHHISLGGFLSNDILNQLHTMRVKNSKNFIIGLSPGPISTTIPASSINDGFTVSFRIIVDLLPLNFATKEVYILKLTNSIVTFSLYLQQKQIHAMIVVPNQPKVRVVVINRAFHFGEWNEVTIGCDMRSKPIRFVTTVNGESLNESEFVIYQFTEDPKLILCEGDSDYPCGYLSDFTFFSGMNHKENPNQIELKQVFNTNNYDEKTVSTPVCTKVFYQLMDCLMRANNATIITKYYENPKDSEMTLIVTEILGTLFKSSSIAQRQFRATQQILISLHKNVSMLTTELYTAFWRVYTIITEERLQNDFLYHLILNTWLWAKSGSEAFQFILNHWTSIVIPFVDKKLTKKNYFRIFLAQYKLFFCDENHDSKLFDEYPKDSINKCQKLFSLLLKRVAFVSITNDDVSALLSYVSSSRENKETVLQFLKLIHDISPAIASIPNYSTSQISSLNYFLDSNDIDIVESSVLMLYNLYCNEINKFTLSAAFQITKEKINLKDLLDRLFCDLQKYENLYPLLIVFMLRENYDMMPLAEIFQQWINLRKNIQTPNHWFVWLIIAAMQKNDLCEVFCHFIAYVLSKSPNRNKELNDIVNFARFIGTETNLNPQKVLEKFFISLYYYKSDFDENFQALFADVCFTSSVFHFVVPSHTPMLLQEFQNSPFNDFSIFQSYPTVFQPVLTDFTHLEHLMYFDVNSIHINFYIELLTTGSWSQILIAKIALDMYKLGHQKNYLQLFIDRTKLDDDLKLDLARMSMEYFDKFYKEFAARFRTTLSEFTNSFRKVLQTVKQLIADSQAFLSLGSNVSNLISKENERAENQKTIKKISETRVRDKKTCMNYCAMKMKYPIIHVKKTINVPTELIFTQSAHLVNKKGVKEIQINISKDSVYLVGTNFVKAFTIQMIRLLLTRKYKGAETAIEFYISDGRSYFVDLSPNESANFARNIARFIGKGQFVQTMPANELFASFPLTIDWARGVLSNFEYLMKLNILSGRSFNCPNLYPVFPSVLMDLRFTPRDISKIKYNEPSLDRVQRTQPKFPIGLEDSVCSQACIPPEFFFLPSTITMHDNVNSFEFIYKHRKVLESAKIRAQLPKFIDNIWGVHGTSASGHHQIFMKPHEQCKFLEVERATKMVSNIRITSHISYIATLKTKNPMVYAFLMFLDDGDVFVYSFGFQRQFIEKTFAKVCSFPIDENATFAANNKGVLRFSPSTKTLSVFKDTKIEVEHQIFVENTIVDYADHSFIYMSDPCTVLYAADRVHRLQPMTLLNATKRIKLLKCHAQAKVFAVALIDGTVEVHSLVDGRFVGSASLNCEPRHLIFTQNSACVVAFGDSEILVLSINGDEMHRVQIESPYKSVFTFSDISDFDYICGEDSRGRLVFFDVMIPEKTKVAFFGAKEIVFATYNHIKKAFVTITALGQLTITPCEL